MDNTPVAHVFRGFNPFNPIYLEDSILLSYLFLEDSIIISDVFRGFNHNVLFI